MPNNSDNLRLAHKAKNDEFYTKLEDIETELVHYRNFLKNKIVLLNLNQVNALSVCVSLICY